MKVLMVHEDAREPGAGGGAESLLRDQAEALRARGHAVEWFIGGYRFEDAVRNFSPDVVHLMTLHNFLGLEPALFCQAHRIPTVWHVQDYWPFCGPRMLLVDGDRSCAAVLGVCDNECGGRQTEDYRAVVGGSYVVAGNRYTAEIYRRNGLRCDGVVELGVDTDLFAPDPAMRGDRPAVYSSTAWWGYPTKGMHVLAAALRGAPYGATVITGVARRVVARELKKASIYVFPSCYEETFGLGLCEAMASGCACVASDVAGAKAQIEEGVTGLIVPKRDPGALREALDRLMGDRYLRDRLGRNARAHVEAAHSLDAMAIRWEGAYAAALKGRE